MLGKQKAKEKMGRQYQGVDKPRDFSSTRRAVDVANVGSDAT